MSIKAGSVIVKQLPAKVNLEHRQLFLCGSGSSMEVNRPCIVIDCSRIQHMDMPAIQLLLDCLEDAMKRNGDIKLAAIPDAAKSMLEMTGVDRLFEVFETSAEAVSSYRSFPVHAAWQGFSSEPQLALENAA